MIYRYIETFKTWLPAERKNINCFHKLLCNLSLNNVKNTFRFGSYFKELCSHGSWKFGPIKRKNQNEPIKCWQGLNKNIC